jgi:hypothetical protein
MAFALDPEVTEALEPMAAAMSDVVPPPVGDVQSRRPVLEAGGRLVAAVALLARDLGGPPMAQHVLVFPMLRPRHRHRPSRRRRPPPRATGDSAQLAACGTPHPIARSTR